MKRAGKIVIVVVLIALVAIVISLKRRNMANSGAVVKEEPSDSVLDSEAKGPGTVKSETSKRLPRLVDLGADKCIPCKMMAPILEELKKEYTEVLNVEFVDVRINPDAAQQYGIRVIPTQIFFDASGNELFRHEGFFSKEDILVEWKQFGVELAKPQ
jgi:thioredoxin 1